MKIYRTNVFETNSSSCHTISLGKDSKLFFAKDLISIIPDYQGNIKIKPIAVEFEWGFDKYNDAATKAIYMLYWNMDSVLIVQAIRDFTGATGNITYDLSQCSRDHETDNPCRDLKTVDEIKEFLFDKNSWLFIHNDNSDTENKDIYKVPVYEQDKVIQPKINTEIVLQIKNPDFSKKEFIISSVYTVDEIYKESLQEISRKFLSDIISSYVKKELYINNQSQYKSSSPNTFMFGSFIQDNFYFSDKKYSEEVKLLGCTSIIERYCDSECYYLKKDSEISIYLIKDTFVDDFILQASKEPVKYLGQGIHILSDPELHKTQKWNKRHQEELVKIHLNMFEDKYTNRYSSGKYVKLDVNQQFLKEQVLLNKVLEVSLSFKSV